MSKPSDEYCTPAWLFDALDMEFGPFAVDVAATKENTKCMAYWNESQNALSRDDWVAGTPGHRWFCNPPFSRVAKDEWIEHATKQPAPGVMLLPVRVMSNKAFHAALASGASLVAIKGRVAFELDGVPQPGNPWPTICLVFPGGGAK